MYRNLPGILVPAHLPEYVISFPKICIFTSRSSKMQMYPSGTLLVPSELGNENLRHILVPEMKKFLLLFNFWN